MNQRVGIQFPCCSFSNKTRTWQSSFLITTGGCLVPGKCFIPGIVEQSQ